MTTMARLCITLAVLTIPIGLSLWHWIEDPFVGISTGLFVLAFFFCAGTWNAADDNRSPDE